MFQLSHSYMFRCWFNVVHRLECYSPCWTWGGQVDQRQGMTSCLCHVLQETDESKFQPKFKTSFRPKSPIGFETPLQISARVCCQSCLKMKHVRSMTLVEVMSDITCNKISLVASSNISGLKSVGHPSSCHQQML